MLQRPTVFPSEAVEKNEEEIGEKSAKMALSLVEVCRTYSPTRPIAKPTCLTFAGVT